MHNTTTAAYAVQTGGEYHKVRTKRSSLESTIPAYIEEEYAYVCKTIILACPQKKLPIVV